MLKSIQHRLTAHEAKVQATVEVSCFNEEGVEAIIRSLRAGRDAAKDKDVKIILKSPPLYEIFLVTKNVQEGAETLKVVLDAIKNSIENYNGTFSVQQEPASVSVH